MSSTHANQNPAAGQKPSDRDAARSLVLSVIRDRTQSSFSAEELLNQHSILKQFPSCVIDLAYEEYCRRREQGEAVAASEFVRKFDGVEQSLYRVIEFDQVLHDHPSLVEAVPDERWPDEGDEFCGFQLMEQIGRGALSRVFIARQAGLGMRQVVVKICVRGEREADLLGQLEHSSIAPVHSIHTDHETGLAVICMPFMTRVTMHHLAEWLLDRQLRVRPTGRHLRQAVQGQNQTAGLAPATESRNAPTENSGTPTVLDGDTVGTAILKWGVQIGHALAYAHSLDILHCDVKPGNVLLLENLTASLLDFNLASSAEDAIRLAGGTLPYMASEQLWQLLSSDTESEPRPETCSESAQSLEPGSGVGAVESPATHASAATPESPAHPSVSLRTDVYGLCATLWHLASGEPPFGVGADFPTRGEAARELLRRQADGITPERIQKTGKILSRGAVDVLLKGLHAEPEQRFADMQALVTALQNLLPKPAGRMRRLARLSWVIVPLVAAGLSVAPVRQAVFSALSGEIGATNPVLDQAAAAEAVMQSRKLLRDDRIGEARDLVAPYVEHDPECRFIHLLCRTGLQKCMVPPESQEHLSSPEQLEIQAEWRQLSEQWEALIGGGSFAQEALFNRALVKLEFGDLKSFREAAALLQRARAGGFDSARLQRIQTLLAIRETGDPDSAGELHRVVPEVLESGTRGEFLLLLHAIAAVFVQPEAEPGWQELREQLLDAIEDPAKPHAGAASVRILINASQFTQRLFLERAILIMRSPTPNDQTCLRRALVLPRPTDPSEADKTDTP
ncbi:MAG: protein kinase [Fuerstiella sp.]